jgi:ABC-type transport system substrate-binding protein
MDKEWAEANNATKTQDFKNKEENYAVRNANGTGAFQLVSREPDVKTVMKRNDAYWGKGADVPLEISEIIYTPIKSDATRVAALLSGEVDFVQDVPVQDIERLKNTPNLRVTEGPENRTIFFGLNVAAKDLKTDNVEGKNPLADKKVRQAMNMAINRAAIQRVVMRGQSVPTEPGQGAPQGGGLRERLPDHHALPERSLRQRRRHLPGGCGHAGPDRHQGEPRLAIEDDPLPADHEGSDRDGLLPLRLGRSDLRLRVRVHLPPPLAHG